MPNGSRSESSFNGQGRQRHSPTFATLYLFRGHADGEEPTSLVADATGNIFGITQRGGGSGCAATSLRGCGTVFKLKRSGATYAEEVIHRFSQSGDGVEPAGLSLHKGVLYGTTSFTWPNGCGTVFAIVPSGAQYVTKTLYAFHGADGCAPRSAPIVAADGAIYGATVEGGPGGFGTVFKLVPAATGYMATVLYAFVGGRDGYWPSGAIAIDSTGNLYGTTMAGGSRGCQGTGCGIAYELHRTNSGYEERVLHRFAPAEGSDWDGLTMSKSGALYGVTLLSCGLLFEITAGPRHSYRALHSFTSSEGCEPDGVTVDAGHIFGTTEFGGSVSNRRCLRGCGTVFDFVGDSSIGDPSILHNFGGKDGEQPVRGVIASNRTLIGTAAEGGGHCPKAYGGGGCGTVFEIREAF